jgi:hypothetical protein
VRLSPLGTSATIWPIAPALDDDNVDQSLEWRPGETEVLGENQSQCYFVNHKFHMSRPGSSLGRRGGKSTNHLSYGTADNSSKYVAFLDQLSGMSCSVLVLI